MKKEFEVISEIIQNNTSHTELPELPEHVKELLDKI